MSREFAKKFYSSKVWQLTRQAYFNSKYGLCERCMRPGSIVHHKKYVTPNNINDPQVTLAFDNLELLCRDCHALEHEGSSTIRKDFQFDSYGNLIQK